MKRLRNLFFALPFAAAIICAAVTLAAPNQSRAADKDAPVYKVPASYVLMERAANDPVHSKTLLEQALKETPDLPPVYFNLGKVQLRDFPGGLASWFYYMVEGFKSYGRNWWWAIDLSGLIGFSLAASFFIALFVTVCLRLPRELPLLKHDIGEQRKHFLLFLVPAVSVFFGPGLFFASLLILLGIYFPRRERILVYLVMLFLAFTPFLTGWVQGVYLISNPGMRAIVAVNEGTDNSLALKTLSGNRQFEGLFSYGLALRRAGLPGEAIAAYEAALGLQKDPRVYVDLANCYLLLGNPGKAGELYTESLRIKPAAAAYFDLAQLNGNTLDYEKGGELYRKATALEPARVASFMDQAGQKSGYALMDDALGMNDFYSIFQRARTSASPGVFHSGLLWLVLIIWLAVFFRYGKEGRVNAFRCSRCGRILCGRCEPEPCWGRMCRECYQSLVKIEALDPKKRVERLLKIHEVQLRRGALIKALALAPPGMAHIYGGSVLRGMLTLWAFLFFAAAAVLDPLLATGLGTQEHSWLGVLSVIICGLLYISTFIAIRRKQGRVCL